MKASGDRTSGTNSYFPAVAAAELGTQRRRSPCVGLIDRLSALRGRCVTARSIVAAEAHAGLASSTLAGSGSCYARVDVACNWFRHALPKCRRAAATSTWCAAGGMRRALCRARHAPGLWSRYRSKARRRAPLFSHLEGSLGARSSTRVRAQSALAEWPNRTVRANGMGARALSANGAAGAGSMSGADDGPARRIRLYLAHLGQPPPPDHEEPAVLRSRRARDRQPTVIALKEDVSLAIRRARRLFPAEEEQSLIADWCADDLPITNIVPRELDSMNQFARERRALGDIPAIRRGRVMWPAYRPTRRSWRGEGPGRGDGRETNAPFNRNLVFFPFLARALAVGPQPRLQRAGCPVTSTSRPKAFCGSARKHP